MKASTKKGILLIGGILGLLLVIAVGMAFIQFNRVDQTLEQLTQPSTPYRELGVYVLQDDPAQELKDTVGYSYGGLERDGDQGFARLGEELGNSPAWKEYPTVFALADALGKGESQAVGLSKEPGGCPWI